ncbi:RWD domain-containing protein [Aspergillus ambiguus]|uniref:RBR-type E3 ubiquitin transferase n=1 Tax=Aspergillus ambiguus TaxID=176160 RepID=UPI003CCD124E
MSDIEDLPDDDRSMELSSITAIFPEITVDPLLPFRATFDLPVKPVTPLRVCFLQQDAEIPTILTPPTSLDTSESGFGSESIPGPIRNAATADADKDVHIMSYLPPLRLEMDLPDGYPAERPPIIKLSTDPPWLPAPVVSRLIDDGRRLWEECGRSLVIYSYIDHLQQLADITFGIDGIPDGDLQLPRSLKVALLDFNNKAEREKFEQETFECGVCLEPKKGVNCHRLLLCSHVFCVPCLQDFYNNCITEGDVDNVRCLDPGCTKEQEAKANADATAPTKKRKKIDRTLSPSELLQIPLEQETVQRYVFLKRKKKLEADKSTIYCPRKWCQGAARSEKHPKPTDPMTDDLDASDASDDESRAFDPLGDEGQLPPMAERVAICEDCNYAFCCVCKKGWHGELVRCFPRREAELSAEEKATEEYLRKYTSPCPTCNAPCQKRMGCNHMKCFKCDTHFCYLCSSWLCEDNPYRHYNDINSGCFNRLWDLEGGDGINPDGAEALHQIPDDLLFDDSDDDDQPAWDFQDDNDNVPPPPQRRRQPPPPAPVPPRVNNEGGIPGNRAGRGGNANGLDAAGRAAAAERQAQARAMAEVRGRPAVGRAGQPVNGDGPVHRPGLQRFLDLVMNDREDEWDSDELDDDF